MTTPKLDPFSAYTSAMFSETRYAMNGDLRVAYRASAEGARELVFVPNWFTNCEVVPELLPSMQGWFDAMTSLGRVIFFDQPGSGASDPVTPGALPTLEQWADSITADWQVTVYGGGLHAFTMPDIEREGVPGTAYDPFLDGLSWAQATAFLAATLS